MSAGGTAAFNHFFKKERLRRNKNAVDADIVKPTLLDVYGGKAIYLRQLPDSSIANLTPLMIELCSLLVRQAFSVEQLVRRYGEEKRIELLVLLKKLNSQGLLHFSGDDDV